MRLREKTASKRYCVLAKRRGAKVWSAWTQTDDLNAAMAQLEKIRKLGFLGKITDIKEQKIITSD